MSAVLDVEIIDNLYFNNLKINRAILCE